MHIKKLADYYEWIIDVKLRLYLLKRSCCVFIKYIGRVNPIMARYGAELCGVACSIVILNVFIFLQNPVIVRLYIRINLKYKKNNLENEEIYIEQIDFLKKLIVEKDTNIGDLKNEIENNKLDFDKQLRMFDVKKIY